MTDLNPSSLCLACKAIFSTDHEKNDSGEIGHHGLDALASRASRGCHLCLTVYLAIDPDAFKAFKRKADSRGSAWISPIARDQARLRFRYVAAPAAGSVPSSSHSSSMSYFSTSNESALVVELMLVNPKYAIEPGVRTLDVKSTSTGSPASLEVAKQWLHDCSFNHMRCTVSASGGTWKPTHLLDVTVKGPKGVPGVRLVDGMFLDPLTEYLTLSHCWGRGKTVRLTKKTLPSLRQGIAASSLPKTFAEAAQATQRLGFRYLWIDALCILHDNEQATLQEISQMHRIYSEAILNLAATSSREDTGGLFYSRNVAALQPCVVEVAGHGIADGVYKCLRSTVWHDLVDSAPLSKRGWVFQERSLAKRTLHFTRNEVLWECQQMCCSEVFPNGLPANMDSPTDTKSMDIFNKRHHHQRTGNWHDLVRMYSHSRLTYASDKLLAISGLARQYMSRNRLKEQDYVAGIWKPQLPHGLLWRLESGRGPPKYRAPSWSWASLDGVVTYPEPSKSERETCIEILDVQVKFKFDPLGQVESGSLKLRGFLVRGLLRRTHDYWGRTPCVIQCSGVQVEIESTSFDERLPKLSEVSGSLTEQLEVYLLPVVDVVDRVEGLVLCATMRNKGEFRRIGAFDISRYDQINWDRFKGCLEVGSDLQNYEERVEHTNGYWFASDYLYTINLV